MSEENREAALEYAHGADPDQIETPAAPTPSSSTQEPSPTASKTAKPSPTATESSAAVEKPKTKSTRKAKSSEKPAKAKAKAGTALSAAHQLTVKGRAPKTGYDRANFGQRWADIDRNGCDQRNDILRRDLQNVVIKAGTQGCVVMSGSFLEPFAGTQRSFQRGPSSSQEIHIDHVVALSDAWQKGAQQWSQDKRTQFGNDFLNLLAVDGRLNQQKGDSDAASWLPPNKAYRCPYVARQVAVKQKYGLWVTAAEQDAMVRVLSSCPNEKLPTSAAIPRDTDAPVSKSAPRSTPKPTPATKKPQPKPKAVQPAPKPQPLVGTPQQDGTDPRFGTCKEANAAGYGPYVQGRDVEYYWYRDRDKDGVACER
ncbi:GmrSD restriction endonuclease domain-containing protein [Micrococcoides hystricis]|uniref:DUF1524 domain-containing protein n=1 Tax=Micrococcoides hystricis TaxID=1572761 RepID=A0ABV6PC94_9MICC